MLHKDHKIIEIHMLRGIDYLKLFVWREFLLAM